MAKVTVIMPSLNVAKYIGACMDSVLAQTLQDIEILSIDAGSTDGTLEILEEYAEQDSRIKVIHSEKRSYGYQLNMGIAMATGEYISVVETDDLIMPEMMETLYKEAVCTGADFVKGAAQLFLEISPSLCFKDPIWSVFNDVSKDSVVLWPKYMPKLFLKDYYLWTGIYRHDFIRQIVLNETAGAAYQDAGFIFQACMKAECGVYLHDLCYLYRQDNMAASNYDRKAFSYFVKEYDYMEKFLLGMPDKWKEVYYQRMLLHCQRKFLMMGISGEFWEESLSDMEILRRRLRYAWEQGILREQDMNPGFWKKLLLFLESPQTIYESYAIQNRPKAEHIRELIRKTSGHDAIIFGSGKRGRFLHMLMEYKSPDTVRAYCDNKENLWESDVQGIMVMSPEEANRRYPDAIYLIAGRRDEMEMRSQLWRLGVGEDRVFTYIEKEEMLLFHL